MNNQYRKKPFSKAVPGKRNSQSARQTERRSEASTSWGKVTDWYDEHLQKKDNYHNQVVFPRLAGLVKKFADKRAKSSAAEGKLEISMLDIACGQGAWVEYLSSQAFAKGWKFRGADVAAPLVRLAAAKHLSRSEFLVAAAESLPQEYEGQFELATCILALQNMPSLLPVFREAAQALKPGGELMFVITHPAFRIPKHTDWIDDRRVGKIYRGADIYMSEERIPISSRPFKSALAGEQTETTWTFHRPFQYYIKALAASGFAVTDLEEWVSHKKSESANPVGKLEDKARAEIPMFMCVVAKKLAK